MIYQGTEANTTGEETQIGTSAFNSSYNNNMYVGYMYESGQVHGLQEDSTIKGVLDTWYQNNLQSYVNDLDGNSGFCGDRTPSTSETSINNQGGTGNTVTYYAGDVRYNEQSNGVPTYECSDGDLYTTSGSSDGNGQLTYPIGLISMDEVWYAGGYQENNRGYYLFTDSTYWTMSPAVFMVGWARAFGVWSTGSMNGDYSVNREYGIRPVVNLRSDIQISSGTGTSTDPYVVN